MESEREKEGKTNTYLRYLIKEKKEKIFLLLCLPLKREESSTSWSLLAPAGSLRLKPISRTL